VADTWDPDLYRRFADERRLPFDDLLGMLTPVPGATVVDLGCGAGELTIELHHHLQAGTTVGVDASPAMLAKAAAEHVVDGVTFREGDLATWLPEHGPVDVAVASASLHWADDHPAVLARWRDGIVDGGQLAVQLPANFDHPSQLVADEVGTDFGLPPVTRGAAVLAPEGYAALLDQLGFVDVTVLLKVYLHHLPTTASVIDWVRGTLLTAARAALDDDAYQRFLERYRAELLSRLGDPVGEMPYLFTFKRLLLHARRPATIA
jgi:trans-aconitate 2-methyltransferase